jgi:hypothetical protein
VARAGEGAWRQAALALAEAATLVARYSDLWPSLASLRDVIARAGRSLIDDLEPSVSLAAPEGDDIERALARAALWRVVNRASSQPTPKDAEHARWSLQALGVGYARAGDPVRALVTLHRLVSMLERESTGAHPCTGGGRLSASRSADRVSRIRTCRSCDIVGTYGA